MALICKFLDKYLHNYIKEVDKKNIETNYLTGYAKLNNVSLTSQFLTSFGIPLILKENKVGEATIQFRFTDFSKKPASLILRNVDLIATPDWNALGKTEIETVEELIQFISNQNEAAKSQTKKEWNNYLEKVIDNAIVQVHNIRIHIEFNTKNQITDALTFSLKLLSMNHVDSHGNQIFFKEKPQTLTKQIQISQFAIAFQNNIECITNIDALNSMVFNFLAPLDFTFKMIHNRHPKSEFLNIFELIFSNPVFLKFDQNQYFSLLSLFHSFQKSQVKQRFFECRRPPNNLINYHMWHYLFRCALKISRPHSFNPKLALRFLKHRKDFSGNFQDDNLSIIANNAIKKFGEKVAFLLIQYSLIIKNKNKQSKRKKDSIKVEDSPFYRKDSVRYQLTIPKFMLTIKSIGLICFDSIDVSSLRIREYSRFLFKIKKCTIDDSNRSNKQILAIQDDLRDFLICEILSQDKPALLAVSGFQIDLYSSFLNRISVFFSNPQQPKSNEEQSLNKSLVMLNPRTLTKFKILLYSCSMNYLIDNSFNENNHYLFSIGVDKIKLRNYSNKSPNAALNIKSSCILNQIKIDDVILSDKFTFKSETTTVSAGHIDKYDFLNDINTKINVSNSTVRMNTESLNKINQILTSILSNTVSNSNSSYSNHHISLTCSDISFSVNTDKSNFQLAFSEIDIKPTIALKNLSIYHESKENPQLVISTIDLNKLPLIYMNAINIHLTSIEFYNLLDEFMWMLNQFWAIQGVICNTNNKEICAVDENDDEKAIVVKETDTEQTQPLTIIVTTINYKMGNRSNSIKIEQSKLIIEHKISVEMNKLEILDSDDQQFLVIDNQICLSIQTTQNDSSIKVELDNFAMNFIWNEIQNIIQYFKHSQNDTKAIAVEESNDTNRTNCVSVEISHSLINIEKSLSISIDNLNFKLISSLNSTMTLLIHKVNLDTVAEMNNITYHSSGLNRNLIITSIDSYFSPMNFDKIANLSFVSNYFKNSKPSESAQTNLLLNIAINQILVHFPFEDDPSFKNHDFTICCGINYAIDQNSNHIFKLHDLNLFFSKITESDRIEYLPILTNKSFILELCQKTLSFETKESCFDIHLSVLDIIELQKIIKNFLLLLHPFLNLSQNANQINEGNQKTLIQSIEIKPIIMNISLCEENREYNKFIPIFVASLNNNCNSVHINENQSIINSSFSFSISYMNTFYGRLEPLMNETMCNLLFSRIDNNQIEMEISFNDLYFTIHPLSFSSLMSSINKFNHSENLLLFKKTGIKSKHDYWVRNCLDDVIHLTISNNETTIELNLNETQSLPSINEEIKMSFQYKDLNIEFTPSDIKFPVYFQSVSVSTVPYNNNEKLIVFSSPLSIENKLDTIITIYINENGSFSKYVELYPLMRYPIPFDEKQYYIESKFELFTIDKREKSNQRNISTFESGAKTETFSLSCQKAPKFVKIADICNNNRPISFVLNVNNDYQTNTRIYEIIPSFAILNYLPCPISVEITEADQKKANKQILLIQHNHKKQVNYFNHDVGMLAIALGFSFDCFGSPTIIKLDEFNELYECTVGFTKDDNSYHFALRIQENIKTHQKEIIVFSPCIIFNETEQQLTISPYYPISNAFDETRINEIQPHVPLFYAPQSYFDNDKSMKISIKTADSFPLLNAIDLMQINQTCSTANIPMTQDNECFYPINCSITLGQYPMNMTRIVTFTPFLYVVNKLPIHFELIPIPSNNLNSFKINAKLNNKKRQAVLIDRISASGLFQFFIDSEFSSPLIQLNNVTRTIFIVKSKNEQRYIELNIIEKKSTFYAYFKTPAFPVPLIIHNSLNTQISASQFNDQESNKFFIEPNASRIFAFNEPFLKSDRIYIEIYNKDGVSIDKFLFSIEEQLSPLVSEIHNIFIETKIIDKNNSRMVQVRYNDDIPLFQSKLISKFSIKTLSVSFQNEELNDIAVFTLKQLNLNINQDQMNTILTFSLKSIQIDDQNLESAVPVCLLGTDEQIVDGLGNDGTQSFLEIDSIFPRGVPLLSVIYYLNVHIKPIFITFDVSFIITLIDYFARFLYRNNHSEDISAGIVLFEPSFNSISVNKTLISFFQVNSMNVLIDSPDQNTFSITTVITKLFKAIVSYLHFSSPELFVTEFNSNTSILFNIFVKFYLNEIIKQALSHFSALKFISKYLLPFSQSIEFSPLTSIALKKSKKEKCANTKLLYNFFNSIELKNIQELANKYFQRQSIIISELTNDKITPSNLLIHHPNNNNNNQTYEQSEKIERFIVGKKDTINNSTKLFDSVNNLFKSKNIERVRTSTISPYYSSVTDISLLSTIQLELFNNQVNSVKFIFDCPSDKNLICITIDSIYILNDQIKIIQKYKYDYILTIENDGNLVIITIPDGKKGAITIVFDAGNNAQNVLLYINTQKMIMQLFGNPLF